MSFGESIFSVGFIQKTTKEDLIVEGNYGIPPQYLCGKTLEGSNRQITKAGLDPLPCGAAQPLWAPLVSLLRMLIPHRL